MSRICGGHQPVLDFHTGLLSKIWRVAQEKEGLFFFHDLDTLEEKGSRYFTIPKPRGRGFLPFFLVESSEISREKLFLVGPVKVIDFGDPLMKALKTLANGKIPKPHFEEIAWRIEKLQKYFPPKREFASMADFNIRVLFFLLPRVGIPSCKMRKLSDLLEKEWKEPLKVLFERLKNFSPNPPFWEWKKVLNERKKIDSWEKAEEFLEKGVLIPKAQALSFLIRGVLKYSMIRGKGQEIYEKEIETKKDFLAPAFTFTSNQGVPPIWQNLVPQNFRPSVLLLWLMGGQFDPKEIQGQT